MEWARDGSHVFGRTLETPDLGRRGDVAQVRGDTGGVHDVEEAQLRHIGVQLEEQGQRLPNATRRTDHGHLEYTKEQGGAHAHPSQESCA
jgi:hypothetical protein